MASKENKVIRRAQALADLARLSDLLAKQFNVELPATAASKDGELAEIQRLEGINVLLGQVLESSKPEPERKAVKPKAVKDGANK